MAPACYLMGTALVGVVAALFLRESAGRHLPGAMPSVDRLDEARAVAALKRTTLASISKSLPLTNVPMAVRPDGAEAQLPLDDPNAHPEAPSPALQVRLVQDRRQDAGGPLHAGSGS